MVTYIAGTDRQDLYPFIWPPPRDELTLPWRFRNYTNMESVYKIPVLVFFILCFSFLTFADDKVYTNEDLKQAPSLDRNSRIDPVTGKVIKNERESSWKQSQTESIVAQAKNRAVLVIHGIRSSKTKVVAMVCIIFLIWFLCLLDILRFEFRGNNKLIWFIAVTFIPLVGCLLYCFIGRRQKKYKVIKDHE